MKAIPKWAVVFGCALAPALLATTAGFADDASPGAAPEQGVWQKHDYSFAYMGFTSTYSCDGLADKLRVLLIAAGARKDAKSLPGACASGFGRPDKFARASLTFYTLAPGSSGGSPDSGPLAGIWRPVAINDRSPRDIRVGDCELVEQFRNSVLPMFTTRGVENHTSCIPHQESGSTIDLRFESFGAAPKENAGH